MQRAESLLNRQLEEDAILVETYVNKRFFQKAEQDLSPIYKAASYTLFSGGKRLRPALLLETCVCLGGAKEDAIAFATALELVHTYSLIHDDLPCMDDDDIRRGKPTSHKMFGEDMAVLAGDGLLTLAFEAMLCGEHIKHIDPAKVIEASGILAKSAGFAGMVGGQMLDMKAQDGSTTCRDLERLQSLKTGALIEAAVWIGALIADASAKQIQDFRTYAKKIGLAFQIKDDLLDIEGEQAVLGKPIGSDKEQGKMTFPDVIGIKECHIRIKELTKEAVRAIEMYENTEFLIALAWFLYDRKK